MKRRPLVLITGACGGMGQACARQMGLTHDLALSDIDPDRVHALATTLMGEGHVVVATHAGDYAERGTATAAVDAARAAGPVDALVHTAGLSPIQAAWDRILLTNIVATEELLQAAESDGEGPPDAVLIASIAGHLAQPHAKLEALLDAPLHDDVLGRAESMLRSITGSSDALSFGMTAYAHSKSAVLRAAERRARPWGRSGARITTISPGVTRTPMGLAEMEGNEAARATAEGAPLGVASPLHIANAATFLLSPLAASITGTDLRIDGGMVPASRHL